MEVAEMMAVAAVVAVDAVRPVDDPTALAEAEAEDDPDDDPYKPPGYLGHAPIPPHYLALEDLGVMGVSLAPWVKGIYNDVYG